MSQFKGLPILLQAENAGDLMTSNPVTIHSACSVEAAAKILSDQGFSAAPVVNDADLCVGVISQTDLVRAQAHPRPHASLSGTSNLLGDSDDRTQSGIHYEPSARVEELMNRGVFTVVESTPAIAVLQRMIEHKVRRLFVINDEHILVGVISAIDIISCLRP